MDNKDEELKSLQSQINSLRYDEETPIHPDEEDEEAELYYERWQDEQFEKGLQRAGDCKCGAWQFSNGKVIHVADCCCGAE